MPIEESAYDANDWIAKHPAMFFSGKSGSAMTAAVWRPKTANVCT
jgi:hypothetical protein